MVANLVHTTITELSLPSSRMTSKYIIINTGYIQLQDLRIYIWNTMRNGYDIGKYVFSDERKTEISKSQWRTKSSF